jgi:hypothetical protein
MTTTASARSPEFEPAARQAVGLLESVSRRLQRLAEEADDLGDRNDLSYLSSLAMLAGYRGAQFAGQGGQLDRPVDDTGDLVDLAVSAHKLLVEHTSGLDPFEVLLFVGEVGALCVELRLHGKRC